MIGAADIAGVSVYLLSSSCDDDHDDAVIS